MKIYYPLEVLNMLNIYNLNDFHDFYHYVLVIFFIGMQLRRCIRCNINELSLFIGKLHKKVKFFLLILKFKNKMKI